MLAVGRKIIGFFPGYLRQEGYSTGNGFSVIGLFVHGKAATVVAVVILAAIAVAIYRFCDPDQPWRGGVLMTSAALAVCTPDFQWYAILLVMLVALDGRPEWLAIAAGGYFANNPNLHLAGISHHPHPAVGVRRRRRRRVCLRPGPVRARAPRRWPRPDRPRRGAPDARGGPRRDGRR